MAASLKDIFDRALVSSVADDLLRAHPGFPRARFVREATQGLLDLELMDRARHIAAALARALPADFPAAVDVIVASLAAEHTRTQDFGMSVFRYLPHVLFVAEHGLADFEPAMRAQYELTKRFTAEFSLGRFLERHPERTLAVLRTWAVDPNVHVRRLVSEGTRPRLPWAPRLRVFERDPRPVIELLSLLRDDPEPYVRRSVANHLNDLAKDQPALLLDVLERWKRGATPHRRWIIRHALRWLIKRGDRRALALLGHGAAVNLTVRGQARPRRIHVGDRLLVTLEILNPSPQPITALVDLAVHFVKANGEARPKVFKVKEIALGPRSSVTLTKSISFAPQTTRTPRPGKHRIEALVNGTAIPVDQITVIPA